MLKRTVVAERLNSNLDELRRRAELESLRPFCIDSGCFAPSANPKKAPITMEELKKLARSWKLHERRNFWKLHTDLASMVDVLLQHIDDTKKVSRSGTDEQSTPEKMAMPPSGTKPSSMTMFKRTTFKEDQGLLPQLYGKEHFGRDLTEKELEVQSKFDHFPNDPHDLEKDLHIEGVTSHDVVWDERRRSQVKHKMGMVLAMQHGVKPEHILEKLSKQRNLAQHLLNYSMQCTEENPSLNLGSIGTFFSVGETEDKRTASLAMIALSNISSLKYVRDMMAEMNCMHKFSGIVALLHGGTSNYGAALLFYYLSLQQELEDRVFQVGSSLIASNASNNEDKHLRNVSLFTLMNLLPCLERLRVSEFLCRTMNMYLTEHRACLMRDTPDEDFADDMVSIFLPIMRGNVSFSNTHATLIAHDMQDLVSAAAAYAVKFNHVEMARLCAEIFLALFQTRDSPPVHQLATEAAFSDIIANLLEVKDAHVLKYSIRAITILSGIPSLVNFVSEPDVLAIVTNVVDTSDSLEQEVVSDLAKFMSNVCHGRDAEIIRNLVTEDKLHVAIMQLMDSKLSGENMPAKRDLCKAVQNLLTLPENCKELTSQVLDTLLTITESATDIAAAKAIFNVSCVSECLADLMKSQVHFGLQHFYAKTTDLEARDIFLSTILQLSRVDQCIVELYHNNIVETLHSSITGHDTQALWPNVIRIILYQVNCQDIEFTEKEMQMVIDLLNIMCHEDTADDIIGKAAVVLAYLSLTLEEVSTVAHLLSSLLDLSDNEVVEESVSVILYNFSCIEKGVDLLLSSESYIHMMIKLMRNGAADVKQNIAKTLRTLCTREKCLELLMKLPPPPKVDPFARSSAPVERGNAPLADFIVIALLRASSDSAKVMCTQAFYNMLIHSGPRAELLEGELWWAITRLSKTDDEEILETTGRALLDLTKEGTTCVALREHHVITFVQEICQDHSENFMSACMRSIKNFAINVPAPYNRHELASLIAISLSVIEQSTNTDTLFYAFNALVLVSEQDLAGSIQDFIDQHTVETIHKSMDAWKGHEGCCLLVACLMNQLSRHEMWVTQCPLKGTADLAVPPVSDLLEVCYHHKPTTESEMYWVQDILGTALNYQKFGFIAAEALADSQVYEKCVYDALSWRGEDSSHEVKQHEVHAVAVLAFMLESWCDSGTDRVKGPGLINAITRQEFLDHKETRRNVMRIVLALTQRARYAYLLLDANFFDVFYGDVSNFKTGLDAQVVYCSTCLRNMALQKDLVPRLLSEVKNLDMLVSFLVDSNPSEEVYVDLIAFFYHAANYKFENEFIINSRFSLDTIDKIDKATKNEEVIATGKYVIAEILEKYSKGVRVDPAFVQSMFVEITHGNSTQVEHFMDQTLFKDLGIKLSNGSLDSLQKRILHKAQDWGTDMEINEEQWLPYLQQGRIPMATTLLDRDAAEPLPHTDYINSDFLPLQQHAKIIQTYPHVDLPDEREWEGMEDHLHEHHAEGSGEEKTGHHEIGAETK